MYILSPEKRLKVDLTTLPLIADGENKSRSKLKRQCRGDMKVFGEITATPMAHLVYRNIQ